MTGLIKYESARFALQQAVEIDEVKDIRDKAQAMAAYARQANDTKLVEWATEIKVRAERKAGQMLAEMPKLAGARGVGKKVESHDATPLSELGISKTQSSRWQKLAAVPDDQFEQAVSAAKEVAGEVTTAAMLRIEKQNRPATTSHKPALNLETEKHDNEDYYQKDTDSQEPEYTELDQIKDELHGTYETIRELTEEKNKLLDSLAAGQLPEDEIVSAEQTMINLRKQIRNLELELDAVKSSRDIYQRDNEQLKKQCKMYVNKLKKLGAGNAKS